MLKSSPVEHFIPLTGVMSDLNIIDFNSQFSTFAAGGIVIVFVPNRTIYTPSSFDVAINQQS